MNMRQFAQSFLQDYLDKVEERRGQLRRLNVSQSKELGELKKSNFVGLSPDVLASKRARLNLLSLQDATMEEQIRTLRWMKNEHSSILTLQDVITLGLRRGLFGHSLLGTENRIESYTEVSGESVYPNVSRSPIIGCRSDKADYLDVELFQFGSSTVLIVAGKCLSICIQDKGDSYMSTPVPNPHLVCEEGIARLYFEILSDGKSTEAYDRLPRAWETRLDNVDLSCEDSGAIRLRKSRSNQRISENLDSSEIHFNTWYRARGIDKDISFSSVYYNQIMQPVSVKDLWSQLGCSYDSVRFVVCFDNGCHMRVYATYERNWREISDRMMWPYHIIDPFDVIYSPSFAREGEAMLS